MKGNYLVLLYCFAWFSLSYINVPRHYKFLFLGLSYKMKNSSRSHYHEKLWFELEEDTIMFGNQMSLRTIHCSSYMVFLWKRFMSLLLSEQLNLFTLFFKTPLSTWSVCCVGSTNIIKFHMAVLQLPKFQLFCNGLRRINSCTCFFI